MRQLIADQVEALRQDPRAAPRWRDQYDYKGGSDIGRATVAVMEPRIRIGEILDLEATVMCVGGWLSVFNPFFDRRYPLPARIAVFDADEEFVGYLLAAQGEPGDRPPAAAWVPFYGLNFGGARFRYRIGGQAAVQPEDAERRVRTPDCDLPPGRYYLQVIYSHRFVEAKPHGPDGEMTEEQLKRWRHPGIERERFRSNRVEIEIIDNATE